MAVHKKKRTIAIITGSRAEYSYTRPIIREIKKRKKLDYGIIVTNMHVLDTFGRTDREIKKDGFKIEASVRNTFDGYDTVTMPKSLSVFMLQLPEILERMAADVVLVAGDRGEQLMAAIVGAHMNIPVAHIQAGELSGNIDGMARHAITKFAHIHFASNKDAADRVIKMGEERRRVHCVGAPQLDDLVRGDITPAATVAKKFALDTGAPNMLFVFHPVTEEFNHTEEHVTSAIRAATSLGYRTIVVSSNSDAGSLLVRNTIKKHETQFVTVHENMPRADYAGLMQAVDVLIGNSSSGILEAPSFGLPVVNIGNREAGRIRAANVIDVGYSQRAIAEGIKKALTPEFRRRAARCRNPYGDGKSAKRIVDILERAPINKSLLSKRLTY